jgi:sarcosine oxidase/L-pipecolate oxidase
VFVYNPFRQCKYPSSWKNALVTAIFKKGDTSLPSNYRPISLISCVGKVMERIIYKPLCQTLSKAFEKSQKTKQHSSFFSREFKIVLYSSINWWTEECLGKKH